MLRQSETYEPLLADIAKRASATPNYLVHGIGASLATHVAVVGGYSLYLLCASWLSSANLPEWMPPQSGVRSQPQMASPAIMIEATFEKSTQRMEEGVAMAMAPLPLVEPPPPEAQDTDVRRAEDRPPLPPRRVEAELPEVISDQRGTGRPVEGRRGEGTERETAQQETPRSATVRKRGHGVAVQTVTSVPSVAARESTGVETEALPQQIFSPAPEYPAEQYAAGIGGRVKIRIELAATGKVSGAAIYRSSGVAALDEAALEAVQRWRFEPASSGRPTAREFVVPIRFIPPDHQRKSSPP